MVVEGPAKRKVASVLSPHPGCRSFSVMQPCGVAQGCADRWQPLPPFDGRIRALFGCRGHTRSYRAKDVDDVINWLLLASGVLSCLQQCVTVFGIRAGRMPSRSAA